MSAVGSKAQKNSVACHGAESTPKIHSLSRVQGCPNLTNAPRDERRDVTDQ